MRAIHLAQLDKIRPAVILTRETVLPSMGRVTVAPITSRVRGLATEVAVGPENGIESASVVTLDNIITIAAELVGRPIGFLTAAQEQELAHAIVTAFDLDISLLSR